jgi:hypothetical protein
MQALVLAPRRAFSAAKSPPAGGITACVLGRRGDPACSPSSYFARRAASKRLSPFPEQSAQRPAAARQQPHYLSLEFLRELTTRYNHQTPSCPIRSLSEVSTISREGQPTLNHKTYWRRQLAPASLREKSHQGFPHMRALELPISTSRCSIMPLRSSLPIVESYGSRPMG